MHNDLLVTQLLRNLRTGTLWCRSVSIADLFERLEELKRSGDIREYAVGQSSLESIFRGFAQQAAEQRLVAAHREQNGLTRSGSERGRLSSGLDKIAKSAMP